MNTWTHWPFLPALRGNNQWLTFGEVVELVTYEIPTAMGRWLRARFTATEEQIEATMERIGAKGIYRFEHWFTDPEEGALREEYWNMTDQDGVALRAEYRDWSKRYPNRSRAVRDTRWSCVAHEKRMKAMG